MKPIAIIQHSPNVPPGYLADAIAKADVASVHLRLYTGEQLPQLDAIGAVVSLGGIMGAYDEAEHPFLTSEKEFLRGAVDAGLPVLGICLGCQMLAAALGGAAFRAERLEAEYAALELSPAGAMDPVVGTLSAPVVSFHEDTWTPPAGAKVLATSARYPHAFRYGSALGIQAHPEASPEMVAGWVDGHGRDRLRSEGVDPDALLADVRTGAAESEARAAVLFAHWLDEVRTASALGAN